MTEQDKQLDFIRLSETSGRGLVKLEGRCGPFYVCPAGGMPDRENAFFYGDDTHHFFFYNNVKTIKNDDSIYYNIEVKGATLNKFRAPVWPNNNVKIEDMFYIKQNLCYYFQLYSPLTAELYRDGIDIKVREVVFTWGL